MKQPGMSVWYDGTKEMIDGKRCLVFVLGTEHENASSEEKIIIPYRVSLAYDAIQ